MSETTAKPVHKRKPTFAMEQALVAVIDRKRVCRFVDYKAIGAMFAVSASALRTTYYLWTKGQVEMSAAPSAADRERDAARQMDAELLALQRWQGILIRVLERTLTVIEVEMMESENFDGWRTHPAGRLVRDLARTRMAIRSLEQGFAEVHDAAAATQAALNRVNGNPQITAPMATRLGRAAEERLAAEALNVPMEEAP